MKPHRAKAARKTNAEMKEGRQLMRPKRQRDRAEYDRSIGVGIPVAGPSNPQHANYAEGF
jgi:hypothetical protein